MLKYLIKLKKSNLYKNILMVFILPIYELFWQYILNFDRKILYFLWKYKKRKFMKNLEIINLDKSSLKLVEGDKDFLNISNKINNEIDNSLSEKIDSKFLEHKNKGIGYNVTTSGEASYKIDILDLLSEDLQKEIFKLSVSDKMIYTVTNYLKVFPILAKVTVYQNFPTPELKQRGAMLWHKDDFGYKSLDLFLNISFVDHNNGPLHAIKKNNPLGVFSKSTHEIKNPKTGERGKLENELINENENKEKIAILLGQGNAFLIDSFRVYHRGGHCKNRNRVMLRFSYQTGDSVRIKDSEENFSYIKSISIEKINSYFIKKLLFYKSGTLNKFIKKRLINFYRLIHYKQSDFFG